VAVDETAGRPLVGLAPLELVPEVGSSSTRPSNGRCGVGSLRSGPACSHVTLPTKPATSTSAQFASFRTR
jgi:hypothetical protein